MYANVKSLVKRFAGEKDGASLTEYALLISLIAVVAVGALIALGGDVNTAIQNLANGFTPNATE